MPVPGENGDERTKYLQGREGREEQIAELRRIEGDHETAERPVAPELTAREESESSSGQVAGGEALLDRLRALDCGFERDGDTGRKHRIEERAGVAHEQPAVARVRT